VKEWFPRGTSIKRLYGERPKEASPPTEGTEYMTLRQIADRFGVDRFVARRWLLKEGYEFVEIRDPQRGNQMVAALPIDVAAEALHRRNDQGFTVIGVKREKNMIMTEDELQAHAILRDVTSAESRRWAIERGDWVDEVSGFVLDEKDPTAFTEASDYVADLEKFVEQTLEHSDGYGNTFDLIDTLRTMVDEYRDLHGDVANMILLGLEWLSRGWREQAAKYHAHGSGKASEE
jgi:hypothetical protein